jgi:hypothetical protein
MTGTAFDRLVRMVVLVAAVCPGILLHAASRNLGLTVDQALVTWQSLTPNSPSNVSPRTVEVTLTSNQDRNDTLELWAYFQDASAALTPTPGTCRTCRSLPSLNFMIAQDAAAWMPVSSTGPYGAPGGSLRLLQKTGLRGQQTSVLGESFNLNLVGVQSVAAGSYLGVIFLVARIVSPFGRPQQSDPVALFLVANGQSSLTVSVTPEAVYWDANHGDSLVPGSSTNVGVPGLTLTVSWQVAGNVATIPVYAFFSDPQTALTSILGDTRIPASSFLMQVDAGPYQPVLPTGSGIGYKCAEVAISDSNRSGTQNYQLHFNINLVSTQLESGNYVGRLYLQAEAVL